MARPPSPARSTASVSSSSSTSSSAPLPSFETLVPPRAPTTVESEEVLVPVDFRYSSRPLLPRPVSPVFPSHANGDGHPLDPQHQPRSGVRLRVDAGPGCGGIAWPAGEVLARYLAHRHSVDGSYLKGKKVLELGSGTGLVGIAAALLDKEAEVWVTDQA